MSGVEMQGEEQSNANVPLRTGWTGSIVKPPVRLQSIQMHLEEATQHSDSSQEEMKLLIANF